MRGKIVRAVGGFYFVQCPEDGQTWQCRARGIFRKDGFRPLVGDECEIRLTGAQDVEGYVEEVLPRRNELIRPPVANIDQALVVFALAEPDPNLSLLDRYLIEMRRRSIPAVIVFNKKDLVTEQETAQMQSIYEKCGCPSMAISLKEIRNRAGTRPEEGAGTKEADDPMRALKEVLKGKTTVLAGPSGAGKSSLTNLLCPEAGMEVGEVSRQTRRGKQTTRHAQLISLGPDTFLLDTPGFSSLDLSAPDPEDLKEWYPEFLPFEPDCRFQGCMHLKEPDCGVKDAVGKGLIAKERYESYCLLVNELKERRRY